VAAKLQARLHESRGLDALSRGDRQSAALELSRAAELACEDDDIADAARASHAAIAFLLRIGEFSRALVAAERLLARAETRAFESDHVRWGLGDLAGVTRLAPATAGWAAFLARIRRGMEQVGDRLTASVVGCRLAVLLVRMGACEEAIELFAEIRPMLSRMGTPTPEGGIRIVPEASEAWLWWGRAQDLLGRETEAERAYRTHPALNGTEDGNGAAVEVRLAELLVENNRLQEALDLLLARAAGNASERALALALASYVYALLNRPDASEAAAVEARAAMEDAAGPDADEEAGTAFFRRAMTEGMRAFEQVYEPDEPEWRKRLVLAERAAVLGLTTHEDSALIREGLEWARRNGERALEARWLRLEGTLALAVGEADTALQSLEAALECELTTGNVTREFTRPADTSRPPVPPELRTEQLRRSRLEAGVGMETLLAIGRAKAVAGMDPLPAWNAAIAAAQRRNRRLILYYALAAKGRWLDANRQTAEARVVWENAVDVLESIRAELRDVESQIGVMEDKEAAYGSLLRQTVESEDAEGAMRLMERAKSRALLEEMRVDTYRAALSPAQEERARELRQAVVRAMRKQMHDPASEPVRLGALKDRLAEVFRTAARRVLPRLPAARAADVARLSEGGNTVLQYFVADDVVVVAAAKDGRLHSPVQLACGKANLVHLLRELSDRITTSAAPRILSELYTVLLQPVQDLLYGARRLVIIPHSVLHAAPVHAFRSPDGRYLVERLTVQYVPSAAVALRAEENARSGGVEGAVLIAASSTPYIDLEPLPQAIHEIEAAAEGVHGAQVLKGVEAVRRQLLRLEGDVSILHFACHAEFDTDDPLLSRLYLADGPLYAYEIERLPCRPRLVVLSACDSGLQRRTPGDETFGLVRSFLGRGTQAVVATLWPVADKSTALLMRAFYQELFRDPEDVAGALRSAQLQLLASGKHSHPFWWAPYTVIGGRGLVPGGAHA
jgi:CHAT domain-containing protein